MDVTFSPAVLAIVTTLLGVLCTAIGVLWRTTVYTQKVLVDELQDRLSAVIRDRDAYRDIAEEAMTALDSMRARARGRFNEDDFDHIPRHPPEHHSLSTRNQDEHAEVMTLRKRLIAAQLDLTRLTSLDYART
jgi:hypothetical protein